MSKLPPVPRNAPMMAFGLVSKDWDSSFLQPVVQVVDRLTPAGVFANNLAALAAGLLVGQVYQTATGEVRIVV